MSCKENMITIGENELSFGSTNISYIPKTIWTYWNGDITDIVSSCINSWRHYNPDYEIIVLDKSMISQYLDIDLTQLKRANDSDARFSDFVRLNILSKYGGIWMDASSICHNSLNWLHSIQSQTNVDMIGYYLDEFTQDDFLYYSPVIESWFFACVPNSPFVIDWCREFMRMNDFENVNDYISNVIDNGVSLQKITGPEYLAIHVSAQYVLQRNKDKYDLVLFSAIDGPFKYLRDGEWYYDRSVNLLTDEGTNTNYFNVPFIKMRSHERKIMETTDKKKNAFSNEFIQ